MSGSRAIPIIAHGELRALEAARDSLFVALDATQAPFAASVVDRTLITKADYQLEDKLLEGLISAIAKLKQDGFYLSFSERLVGEANDWWIPLDAIVDYQRRLFRHGENVVFSKDGDWGLIFHHEYFALAGGSSVVLEKLRRARATTDEEEALSLIETWRSSDVSRGYRLDWIGAVLEHTLGRDRARTLILESGVAGLMAAE